MFSSLSQEDRIIYSVLLVVSILVILIIWWGVKVRREQDEASGELTLDEVLGYVEGKLFSQAFLWCIWQGRLSSRQFLVHIRNETGKEIAVLTIHHIPKGRVLKELNYAGKHFEYFKEGLWSNRTFLRDTSTNELLFSCRHETFRQIFHAGSSDREIFRIPYTTVFREYRPVMKNEREIGRFFMPGQLKFHMPVLTLEKNSLSETEQLFLLASVLGK